MLDNNFEPKMQDYENNMRGNQNIGMQNPQMTGNEYAYQQQNMMYNQNIGLQNPQMTGNEYIYQQQNMMHNQNIGVQYPHYFESKNKISHSNLDSYQGLIQEYIYKNLAPLISAILLFVAMISSNFVHYVDWGDFSKDISMNELCSYISRGAKYLDSGYKYFAIYGSFIFYLTLATMILLILGIFIDVLIVKRITSFLLVICFIVLTIIIKINEPYISDYTTFGTGYFILATGIVISIVSLYKDKHKKHSLSANSDLQRGEWRCPKCDAKNVGSFCKVCGNSHRY